MAATFSKSTESTSLIRGDGEAQVLPGLVPIGDRTARGIRTKVTEFCPFFPHIAPENAEWMTFAEWRARQFEISVTAKFKIRPLKGQMLIVIPIRLVSQLVDCFYGGDGSNANERAELSKAEICFVERMGDSLVDVIAAAWADVTALTPSLVGIETDMSQLAFLKDADQVIAQTLTLTGNPFGTVRIDCVYPAAALRSVKALSENRSGEEPNALDTIWRERMRDAMMQVSLPVRTIFARTELPLTRLLSLQTGDLIPICLPNRIPMTVGGLTFAEATVGESNGRASIRIEKLEQGFASHD
jgi:flagellar motor switch protein FliM